MLKTDEKPVTHLAAPGLTGPTAKTLCCARCIGFLPQQDKVSTDPENMSCPYPEAGIEPRGLDDHCCNCECDAVIVPPDPRQREMFILANLASDLLSSLPDLPDTKDGWDFRATTAQHAQMLTSLVLDLAEVGIDEHSK
jgi:hypothetical protein